MFVRFLGNELVVLTPRGALRRRLNKIHAGNTGAKSSSSLGTGEATRATANNYKVIIVGRHDESHQAGLCGVMSVDDDKAPEVPPKLPAC